MTGKLQQLIKAEADRLEAVGIDSGVTEIEWMLCHLMEIDRLQLYLYGEKLLTDDLKARLNEVIERRLTRYPLQFILNESFFYGRKFYVNEHVMAPTPETELLCEQIIKYARANNIANVRILEIGVGSGVISVTLAKEIPDAQILAVDISDDALAVARQNVNEFELSDRITLLNSNFFQAVPDEERFDLIVSNPPYIAEPDYPTLMPEVLADPKIAMTAGDDGLNAVRVILRDGPDYLMNGGRLMFEIGQGQAAGVAALTENDTRFDSLVVIKDFNDIDRIIILSCKG